MQLQSKNYVQVIDTGFVQMWMVRSLLLYTVNAVHWIYVLQELHQKACFFVVFGIINNAQSVAFFVIQLTNTSTTVCCALNSTCNSIMLKRHHSNFDSDKHCFFTWKEQWPRHHSWHFHQTPKHTDPHPHAGHGKWPAL